MNVKFNLPSNNTVVDIKADIVKLSRSSHEKGEVQTPAADK